MADNDTQPRLIQFEDFELDKRAGELRKANVKLKLTGQPLLVLVALAERPGDVVTRDELQKRLWPDTFVDVDHNLNTAVNKIREALGDSAERLRGGQYAGVDGGNDVVFCQSSDRGFEA